MFRRRRRVLGGWFWRVCFSSAVLTWMVLIFYLSSLSYEEIESGHTLKAVPISAFDNGMPSIEGHLILYGVLGWLALATLYTYRKTVDRPWRWALLAAAFATLYGVTDEIHQSLVPGRTPSLSDVFWDGLGAVAAAATFGYLVFNWAWLRGQASLTSRLRLIFPASDLYTR